jgi:Icc-related predicted phosphoesterase
MKIDCIGCLHDNYPELEGGDLLIVTGDITATDQAYEYIKFLLWLEKQKYSKKIFIAGNHDMILEKIPPIKETLPDNVEYLCDSGTEFEGLKIWGSPWSHRFIGINPKCTAFTYFDEIFYYEKKVVTMPTDIDILITHEPAYGILDSIPMQDGSLFHVGSKGLSGWLKYVCRPKLHVFSHIHEAYGQEEYFATYNDKMMISVNCSHVNERYKPINKPIRIDL